MKIKFLIAIIAVAVAGFLLWQNGAFDMQTGNRPIEGVIAETFVSARAFVLRDDTGKDWSFAIDDETSVKDANGEERGTADFSLILTPGKRVSVEAELESERVGVARTVHILSE